VIGFRNTVAQVYCLCTVQSDVVVALTTPHAKHTFLHYDGGKFA
jgi:hypothetical protein